MQVGGTLQSRLSCQGARYRDHGQCGDQQDRHAPHDQRQRLAGDLQPELGLISHSATLARGGARKAR